MSNVSVTLFINPTHYGSTCNHLGYNPLNGISPKTHVEQSIFIGNQVQIQVNTNDPILACLQAKELETSKTEKELELSKIEVRMVDQSDHLGREDEVSNVYVTNFLDKQCDLINTG